MPKPYDKPLSRNYPIWGTRAEKGEQWARLQRQAKPLIKQEQRERLDRERTTKRAENRLSQPPSLFGLAKAAKELWVDRETGGERKPKGMKQIETK